MLGGTYSILLRSASRLRNIQNTTYDVWPTVRDHHTKLCHEPRKGSPSLPLSVILSAIAKASRRGPVKVPAILCVINYK